MKTATGPRGPSTNRYLLSLLLSFLFFSPAGIAAVRVQGRTLLVDGKAFAVKGVCYSPVPVGYTVTNYNWWADANTYATDFPLIRSMNANTIRIYSASSSDSFQGMLDAAASHGLYVIMGYWVDPADNVGDAARRTALKNGFVDMVNKWKAHPAILMWAFGNEADRRNTAQEQRDWYTLLNEAAAAAHAAEGAGYHPVTTANQEMLEIGNASLNADDISLSSLDVWGVNVYRGKSFGDTVFADLSSMTSKPYLFTEWGCDAFNGGVGREDQPLQDAYVRQQWSEIALHLSSGCVGGTVFEWCDEWWKGASVPGNASTIGQGGVNGPSSQDTAADWQNAAYTDPNMNEEWWGIAAVSPGTYSRAPRLAYYSLRDLWREAMAVAPGAAIFEGEVKNFPNPVVAGSGPTRIRFTVRGTPRFEAALYDVSGNKVCDFTEIHPLSGGLYRIDWEGRDANGEEVPSGLYVCKIRAWTDDREEIKYRKIAVVK